MKGRIRSVKPEALKDPDLWDLEEETGLPIFRAFVGLWTQADREGRFEWKPRVLKTDILPYWAGDFSRVLDALVTRGFVVRYRVADREYGLVRTFKRHQVINNRESPSELPRPDQGEEISHTSTGAPRDADASSTREVHAPVEGIGSEGIGSEGNGRARAGRDSEPPPPPSEPFGSEPQTFCASEVDAERFAALWRVASQKAGVPGHGYERWKREFQEVALAVHAAAGGDPEHVRNASVALCAWFWHADAGPIQGTRLDRYFVDPAVLAKHVQRDLAAARKWWGELDGDEQAALLEEYQRPNGVRPTAELHS